jgi:hypothetical protein
MIPGDAGIAFSVYRFHPGLENNFSENCPFACNLETLHFKIWHPHAAMWVTKFMH